MGRIEQLRRDGPFYAVGLAIVINGALILMSLLSALARP